MASSVQTTSNSPYRQELVKLAASPENRDKLSTPQAIVRIVNGKATLPNIKKSIFLTNKSQQHSEQTRWHDPKRQQEILTICQEACELTKQQRQQSMRSTEKNLSEMNDVLLKMRKSLSDRGILQQASEQDSDADDKDKQKGTTQLEQIRLKTKQNTEGRKMTQSDNHNNEKDENQQIIQLKDDQEEQLMVSHQSQTKNEQNNDKQDEIQSEEQAQLFQEQSKLNENQQLDNDNDDTVRNLQQTDSINNSNKKEDEQQEPMGKNYMHPRQYNKNIESIQERQGEQSTIIDNNQRNIRDSQISASIKTHNNANDHNKNYSYMHQTNNNNNKNNNNSQQYYEKQQNKQAIIQEQELKAYENNTNRDNQFIVEHGHGSSKNGSSMDKSRIFRPKLGPNQRLISLYPVNHFAHLSTQQQIIYGKIVYKLSKLFQHYIRQIKPTALTFDTIPKSLDLTTTLKYYKQFELTKLVKPGEISKIFKKLAVNGLWLQENGFLTMNKQILEIPNTIDSDLQFCQLLYDKMQRIEKQNKRRQQQQAEKEEKEEEEENGQQNNVTNKDNNNKQIETISEAEQKRYDQIFHKLSAINDSYLPDQKVSKKLNIRFMSPKTIKHQFDVDKLRDIIKSHAGPSKQLIKKISEEKKQQEVRHQMQVQRILEKYKNHNYPENPKSQANSSTKSLKIGGHHKVDSYALRNRIKKGANTISNIKTMQDSHVRLKSQGKLQQYFLERNNTNQRSEILTQVSQLTTTNRQTTRLPIQKRIQVYRELSLPKLPRRQLRDQSIYQSLMKIDVKPELDAIKHLVQNVEIKEQDEYFNSFIAKQRIKVVKQKQQRKKSPVQQRMKFT